MMQQNPIRLRSGLSLTGKQADAIFEVLSQTLQHIPARFILVSDVSGQVVGALGDYNKANLLAISSLMVGDLAASQEIARLTGEYHDQQIVLREGKKARTLIAEAGNYLAIFVQVSNEVPLGWARINVLQMAQHLTQIEQEVEATNEPAAPTSAPMLDLGLPEGDDLSDLFDSALDEIWQE